MSNASLLNGGNNRIFISGHFYTLGQQALLALSALSKPQKEIEDFGYTLFYTSSGYISSYTSKIQESPSSYNGKPFYLMNILEEITEPTTGEDAPARLSVNLAFAKRRYMNR